MKHGILVGTGLASATALGMAPWKAAVLLGCLLAICIVLVTLFAFHALNRDADLTLRHYDRRHRREQWTVSLRRTSRRSRPKDGSDSE